MSELPKAPHHYDGDPPWKNDPKVRADRHVLVPDTVEWSGKRPRRDERRHGPVEYVSPNGWHFRLPIFDWPKGRVVATSSCTGLETPILPFGDHAWDFLELAEAAANEFLSRGWQISRVDFARDLRIPHSREYVREYVNSAASRGLSGAAYFEEGKLGVTFIGVAGGDRLRIYHKGLETRQKFGGLLMDRRLADVVRVELQLRKGQLDEKLRKDVRALQTARVEREPREDDIPVIGIKPAPGHRLQRRHLWAMKRDRHGRRAVEATEAVDRFLMEQGLDKLIPGAFCTELPDPLYGETPQHRKRR